MGLAQYDGSLGSDGAYRIFGQVLERGRAVSSPMGVPEATGGTSRTKASGPTGRSRRSDALTVQGDLLADRWIGNVHHVVANATTVRPSELWTARLESKSADMLGRWTHTFSNGSDVVGPVLLRSRRSHAVGHPRHSGHLRPGCSASLQAGGQARHRVGRRRSVHQGQFDARIRHYPRAALSTDVSRTSFCRTRSHSPIPSPFTSGRNSNTTHTTALNMNRARSWSGA